MRFADKSYNLRIELDTKNCQLSPNEIHKMERGLDPLREPVRAFPVADLYVTITFHSASNDYKVKTSLVLSGKTLATGDHDSHHYTAFERCVRKLLKKVEAYKANLDQQSELSKHEKGTHHDILPDHEPDIEQLQEAVARSDYATFRQATYVYEEPVRLRIGRWIARYPEIDAQIGETLQIADIVEEVFLNAFERFEQRPEALRLGQWLEHLIDPSVKVLLKDPDGELENISFVRSMTETERGT